MNFTTVTLLNRNQRGDCRFISLASAVECSPSIFQPSLFPRGSCRRIAVRPCTPESRPADRYELAMRSWADHDPRALKVVREIYQQRKKFVRGFFTRLGFRGMDADARTRLALCYLSWEPNMLEEESSSRSLAHLKAVHQLLTKREDR